MVGGRRLVVFCGVEEGEDLLLLVVAQHEHVGAEGHVALAVAQHVEADDEGRGQAVDDRHARPDLHAAQPVFIHPNGDTAGDRLGGGE